MRPLFYVTTLVGQYPRPATCVWPVRRVGYVTTTTNELIVSGNPIVVGKKMTLYSEIFKRE